MAVTGIFGGAFDPPHVGHVSLAEAAVAQLGLDRLLVTVVEHPGHRGVVASAADRLELARLAFAGVPGVVVQLEPERYTVDALERLGLDDPIFLVGADELAAFPTWKQPERVLDLARLGVATRPGYVAESPARLDRVLLFEIEPVDVSACEIRARIGRGEPIDGLVPPAVAVAIDRLGLYRRQD